MATLGAVAVVAVTAFGPVAVATGSVAAAERDPYLGVRCVRLLAAAAGDVVVNTCQVCRQVGVERTRPGARFPTTRTVVVPPGSRIELGFRGPGRTRVVSEEACWDEGGKAAEPAGDGRQCVQFGRLQGSFVLFNACPQCRRVVVERTGPDGGVGRTTYLLAPRSRLPFPSAGAAKATIAAESACR